MIGMKEIRVCIRGKLWVDWKIEVGIGVCIKFIVKLYIIEVVFN